MTEAYSSTSIRGYTADATGTLACLAADQVFDTFLNARQNANVNNSNHLIFLVDSSGSMCDVWPYVAQGINQIVSHRPNTHILKWASHGVVRKSPLHSDIHQCLSIDISAGKDPGLSTYITEAAIILCEHVTQLLSSETIDEFIVVFISDGEGYTTGLQEQLQETAEILKNHGTVMDMTTIGVGSEFPTQIAMDMRSILHSGRDGVPLCSVVENEKEFLEALDGLSEFISARPTRINLMYPNCGVRSLPWASAEPIVRNNVAFLLESGVTRVKLGISDSISMNFNISIESWTFPMITQVARQFIWALQANSLHETCDADELKKRAAQALEIVEYALSEFENSDTAESGSQRLTVQERVARKQKRGNRMLIDALLKELRLLRNGTVLHGLSNVELAQRLAIGTMEGRFHQRAMKWKGLELEEFESRREQFRQLLADQKLMNEVRRFEQLEVDAGYRCAITLESNAEVLTQGDLSDAVSSVTSQYFLVDVLPLCGMAVQVPRTDAAAINPWMARVAATAPLTPVLSTAALRAVAGTGTQARLNAGQGETDVVNAVCALVVSAEHARALKPFLTSPLYQVLHTHNTCGNVDTVDRDAHPALLAATICHLLDRRHEGAPMQDWLDAALLTLREFYSKRFGLEKPSYTTELIKSPKLAVVTASPELKTKCQCTSKPIAVALAWKSIASFEASSRSAIARRVVVEWIGRVAGQRRMVRDWFELRTPELRMVSRESDVEVTEELVLQRVREHGAEKFFTSDELWKQMSEILPERYVQIEHNGVNVKSETLRTECFDGAVSMRTLEQFVRIMLGNPKWELGKKETLRFLLHAVKHPASIDRAKRPILSYEDSVAEVEKTLKREAQTKYEKYWIGEMRQAVVREWRARMAPLHSPQSVMPMTFAEITRLRTEMGLPILDEQTLGYRSNVGLCSFACMARDCPHFLKLKKNAANHYTEAITANLGHPMVTALSIAVASCVGRGIFDSKRIMSVVQSGEHMQYPDEELEKQLNTLVRNYSEKVDVLIQVTAKKYRKLYKRMKLKN